MFIIPNYLTLFLRQLTRSSDMAKIRPTRNLDTSMIWYFFLFYLTRHVVCLIRFLACLWHVNIGHLSDTDTTSQMLCPCFLAYCRALNNMSWKIFFMTFPFRYQLYLSIIFFFSEPFPQNKDGMLECLPKSLLQQFCRSLGYSNKSYFPWLSPITICLPIRSDSKWIG